MSYEPMKDSYKAYLYVQVICPSCGSLMFRGSDGRTLVCANQRDCELSSMTFEAPWIEMKRYKAREELDQRGNTDRAPSAPMPNSWPTES